MDMMLSWQIEKNDVKAQEKERLSPCQQSGKSREGLCSSFSRRPIRRSPT